MTPANVVTLANAIYPIVLDIARRGETITYVDLASQVKSVPRSKLLHAALGQLVQRCHQRCLRLPALPALVVRVKGRRPGPGYYSVAHPNAVDPLAEWEQEKKDAWRRARDYPATAQGL